MRNIALVLALALAGPQIHAAEPKAGDKEKPAAAAPAAAKAEKAEAEDDIGDILDGMGYPELQVVPRASERLKMEAKSESSTWWMTHWPIELAGLVTLYVGTSSKGMRSDDLTSKEKKDANTVASLTTAVGAAWVIGGIALGAQRPYGWGNSAVSKVAGKDERSALLRERLAEEALERPAKTMRVLEHLAVASNVALNAVTVRYSNEKGMVTAGIATLVSFLPYMFEDPTISVYNKHIEYKKKIYAPLKTVSMHFDPFSKELTPMSTLVWTF